MKIMRGFAFLAILCASLSTLAFTQDTDIPSPESVFGFVPGSDRQLIDYGELSDYMLEIAAASDRVEMREVGTTPLGRRMYVAFISSPENLARLDELQEVNRRLALDPDIPEETRANLIREGRVFVMETLSMHSGEVGPSQSLPAYAHRLATTDDAETLAQLDDVVLMMVLCHNPDGMDMVVENYREYVGTPYEGSSLPRVYHKYVGHDNNRDFVTLTQEDTRVISDLYSTRWYPQVLVEKHQMGSTGPRYFVPPNHDPIAENVDEGMWTWSAVFGSNLSRDLAADGLQGVASHWLFDDYWPGSTETSIYKGVISFLTEAASCRTATPIFVEPTELTARGKGLSEYKKGVNMPIPWPGGRWGLDDIIALEHSSMDSILGTASRHRKEILEFRNDHCRREFEKGRSEAPYYFVIPRSQRDPGERVALVQLLERHGVDVERLTGEVIVDDHHFVAGDVVVRLSQPYRTFVKEVMESQRYPERHYTPGGELIRPYDITSWSLPLHMGVRSIEVDTRSEELEALLAAVTSDELSASTVLPENVWAVAYPSTCNQSYKAVFAALSAGFTVERFAHPFGALPSGSFAVLAGSGSRDALRLIVEQSTIEPTVFESEITDARLPVRMPSIGLVETHFHDMDAGWTRYLFDTYGIPYKVLHPEDFEGTNLKGEFDVIVFPDASEDILTKGKYKRGDRYVTNDYPPKFRQPITKEGRAKLTDFITDGGVVVSWGRSTSLFTNGLPMPNGGDEAETLELPVRDVSERLEGVSVPGAFLAADFIQDHPLTWGMPAEGGVFSRGTPVFATSIPILDTDRRVIATYPERDLLLSGYIAGEKQLQHRPNMVWLRAGKGQLVLIGFRPQFRGSTPATFKLVFNSLLLPSLK
ncbi:MAG: M14 family metallopeptidase [Acidobacteria bacterium]|nr:M14 family metallopeptidase [Acidobacteriota bacterium]